MVSLNPSFSGWPALGYDSGYFSAIKEKVLIPLLVDDPLWGLKKPMKLYWLRRLNPSFSGWPALGNQLTELVQANTNGLNPSFSGWPALGKLLSLWKTSIISVLIPLLVDDPLWGRHKAHKQEWQRWVLIPLLVDDPLWVISNTIASNIGVISLNPSFSGWPALGAHTWIERRTISCLNPSFSGWPALGSKRLRLTWQPRVS